MPSQLVNAATNVPDSETVERTDQVTHRRSRIRISPVAIAVTALFAALGHSASAAAQGVIGTGSGRGGAIVAVLVALGGLVAGGIALARARKRIGAGHGRDGAIVGVTLAIVGIILGGLHLATSSGGFGTGNGRAGAVVALLMGLIGVVLGRVAEARARRTV